MANFTPTPSQAAAIGARGSTVLISAGAGSGKTKVLTERLMGYVTAAEEPKDIDSFLIITFTRAAAGELRGRIAEELASAVAEDPGNRHLRRQNALIQRAEIGTIHSFCAALLRRHSHLLSLPPDFKIVDDDRAAAMKATALERVMDEGYAHPESHPGFLALVDTVGNGRDDRSLCALVLELHEKMQCHARPDLWAERMVESLREEHSDVAETVWGQELLRSLRRRADYWCRELERLLADARQSEAVYKAYGPALESDGEKLRDFARALAEGWDSARAHAPQGFEKLGVLRKSPDPELSERIKARRDAMKKSCAKCTETLLASSEQLLRDMARTEGSMSALLQLTLAFDAQYARDKRRAALVDYADLEHMAARLLTNADGSPTELAETVSQRYTEIMVDEYQDVSQVQDTIFRAVSRGGKNLFFVGDVKQSIYRFRLADPEIFTDKYRRFADWELAAPGDPRKIMLQENFRSRREILDAANSVFSLCMSRELGDIDYDEAAALKYGAGEGYAGSVPRPELQLLAMPKAQDDEQAPVGLELEADMVAREIRDLIAAGTRVGRAGSERSATYSDVAILLRSANSVGRVFRNALLRYGIPASASQGADFFTSVEISTVMSLLALVDNPHRDIALIAALRAPCFGFSADELSAIRAMDKNCDLFSALQLYAAEQPKAADFLTVLGELRTLAADTPCAELVWQIIEKLDLLAVFSAMHDGRHRRENLLELVSLSERFEATGYRGLHRFVLWLQRLQEKGGDVAGSSDGSGVKILSIHKSKGLEFPIVFLSDLGHSFNMQDSRARVLLHPVLGLGPKVTDRARRIEYPTLARNAIALRQTEEMLSEEMRLLYVGMTRPKERLIMTAHVKKPDETVEKLRSALTVPMASEALASARSMLSWLITAALADDGRTLSLQILSPRDEEESADEALPHCESDAAFLQTLRERLSFRYPFPEAEELPSKITATELKGHDEHDEESLDLAPKKPQRFREPDFLREQKPLSGTERGTATHLVLQYMDFSKTASLAEIQGEISRLRDLQFLSPREAEAVDAKAIAALFASPLGRRMLSAPVCRREFKFSLLLPTEEVFREAAGDEVLLQGVVDCCIEEGGELVIIDYKTDSVHSEQALRERAALYAGQVKAYAAALQRIFGKEVDECVLYFLSMGREVHIKP